MTEHNIQTRRAFMASATGAGLMILGRPIRIGHRCRRPPMGLTIEHPDPRPGIDGSNVLAGEQLAGFDYLIDVYDGIRAIPHIADGILCMCGCAGQTGMRSLLGCYESSRYALGCEICQTEGRMVVRYHKEGRTLDQIRAAITARFG